MDIKEELLLAEGIEPLRRQLLHIPVSDGLPGLKALVIIEIKAPFPLANHRIGCETDRPIALSMEHLGEGRDLGRERMKVLVVPEHEVDAGVQPETSGHIGGHRQHRGGSLRVGVGKGRALRAQAVDGGRVPRHPRVGLLGDSAQGGHQPTDPV